MASTLHPPSSRPVFLATALALVATVMALAALLGVGQPAAPSSGDEGSAARSTSDPRVIGLERRLTALERRPAPSVVPSAAADLDRSAVADPRIDALVERLAALDSRLGRLEARSASELAAASAPQHSPEEIAVAMARRRAAEAVQLQSVQATILDANASVGQKVAAWGRLRSAGPEAWNDAIVDQMARIGLTADDPNHRADVWRQADAQARSERLVPALLQALTSDTDDRVREEAAETLENYRELPQVRAALESAAANDPAEKVRNFARRSLERRAR
ncbi:MAG: HEAT repeat domain-containing protein [Planctomycetes bacterium]|nr:HEAT repeat domain-containing protein [Planctomycetota bacterium]